MMDCLRQESVAEKTTIKATTLFPGAIKKELLGTDASSAMKTAVEQFYEQVGIEPEATADAIAYALSRPDNVDVSEFVIRPLGEA